MIAMPIFSNIELSLHNRQLYSIQSKSNDIRCSRTFSVSLQTNDTAPDRISGGKLIWKTFGYYSIYKIGCISLGLSSVGYATGYIIGSIIPNLFGDKTTANDMTDTANLVMIIGITASATLAMAGPFIVAHNIHMEDPEAPYDDMLKRGLISELGCNIAGIALLSLVDHVDSGFWSTMLGVCGFLVMLLPTPSVMFDTYSSHDPVTEQLSSYKSKIRTPLVEFSVAEYSSGLRQYSIMFTAAEF